jgi:hypothetical protein
LKTIYVVKFTKAFVNGNLKDLTFDSYATFETLDAAAQHVAWCHEFRDVPVSAVAGPDYTIHGARIETIDVSPENVPSILAINESGSK